MSDKVNVEPAKSILVRTPMFRMSYPNLAKPTQYKNKGEFKYSCQMLFNPDDINDGFQARVDEDWVDVDIKQVMAAAAKFQWPDINIREAVTSGSLGWPLKDGNDIAARRESEGKKGDIYENLKVLSMGGSKKYPPLLYVMNAGKFVELDRAVPEDLSKAEALFRGGSYAKATVNVVGTESPQGRWVKFYANAVLFWKEGPRIGGLSGEDRFGGIDGGDVDYDPTEGMFDELEF